MSPLSAHEVSADELDHCAREAIHQTTLLQPHGFLIACDVHSGLIVFASSNAGNFLAGGPQGLLGQSLDAVVDGPLESTWARLRAMEPASPIVLGVRLKSGGAPLDCCEVLVHRSGDHVVIEAMHQIRSRSSEERWDTTEME